MLQEQSQNNSNSIKLKHGFAVDHDSTVSNLQRAQSYFGERYGKNLDEKGLAKEDVQYYDEGTDSFFFWAKGTSIRYSSCIEDVAFQKIFFSILSANNALVVSGTHRLTANKPDMLEGMYKAYDACFGSDRSYLKPQPDLKLPHEDNSKNGMLSRLKEINALDSLTLIDDEPEFGENLEPMNETGIKFQLVEPSRIFDFENAPTEEAAKGWLTSDARKNRNQYMFDVLERELDLEHLTYAGFKKSLDALSQRERLGLALQAFKEFYKRKNTERLQRLCEADDRLAMLTYLTRVGSIAPLALMPAYIGAEMTVPYIATVSIKTTAAMIGLIAGAITLALANLAATVYLFKNSYNKTAATVGLLNAVGTGLILFGSANVWNPVGWLTLGLAALVAVVGCIHAKWNKPSVKSEVKSESKSEVESRDSLGSRASSGFFEGTTDENTPCSSNDSDNSTLYMKYVDPESKAGEAKKFWVDVVYDNCQPRRAVETAELEKAAPVTADTDKAVVAKRKGKQVSKQGGGITKVWVQKLRAERNVKDRQRWLETLYLNPSEYLNNRDAVDDYFFGRQWKGVSETVWADWYDFNQYQSSGHRRETEALFKKMEWKIPEIGCDRDSQMMHKEFMRRMSENPRKSAESIDWPWNGASSVRRDSDTDHAADRAFAKLVMG